MADPLDDVSGALARADAAYEPIPAFADWAPDGVDLSAWDEAKTTLDQRRAAADPADVAAALQERLRAAAVDTGAIEGLYDTDRGFTLSVAQQAISLDQAEVEKGGGFRRHFEAQLEGFERALDAATAGTPISEAFIRHLHEVTCAGQEAYRVITPVGVQERRLALGTYKVDPNHVQLGDGSFHAYAPVDRVADEMHRLVEQLRSPEFEAAHPVVQAAYSHHAFTWIHPFPDGNGRVARLLASIWLLRAASIPLWIEASERSAYLDALARADEGDPSNLADLVETVSTSLIRELALVLRLAVLRVTPEVDPLVLGQHHAQQILLSDLEDLGLYASESRDGEMTEGLLAVEAPWCIWIDGLHAQWHRTVAVDLRRAEAATRRFSLLSSPGAGELELEEMFSEREFVPEVTESAKRRLRAAAETISQLTQRDDGRPSLPN